MTTPGKRLPDIMSAIHHRADIIAVVVTVGYAACRSSSAIKAGNVFEMRRKCLVRAHRLSPPNNSCGGRRAYQRGQIVACVASFSANVRAASSRRNIGALA